MKVIMTYEKAITKAKVLNLLTPNKDMTYNVGKDQNDPYNDDFYVIQYYKEKFAGIAAY